MTFGSTQAASSRGDANARVDAPPVGGGGFSILPKAFQKTPALDVNVITEHTREGLAVPLPTAEKPTYYLLQAGSQVSLGVASGGENPPSAEDLRRTLQKALAQNHYVEAALGDRRATLAIVFTYGSAVGDFQVPQEVSDAPIPPPQTAEEMLPFLIRGQNHELNRVLERAALVGGARFAQELRVAIEEEIDLVRVGAHPALRNPSAASPFQRLLRKSNLTAHLVEVAFHDCYYVVASAYESAALSKGERKLLWRTKITLDSAGVSMEESMRLIIASASPYLGRPMKEAATVRREIFREGIVEIGEATVVEGIPEQPTKSAK